MSEPALIIEPPTEATSSIIWLHGLGADAQDFVPLVPQLNLPVDHAIRFIFPSAPVRPITFNGGYPMRAWYDITSLNRSEFTHDIDGIVASAKMIEAMILHEKAQGIAKIILAGFSQGGAIALFLTLTSHIKLAGVLVLSSYLPAPEEIAGWVSATNQDTPILMMHGTDDPVIAVSDAALSYEIVKGLEFNILWQTYSMTHTVCPPQVLDMATWLIQTAK